MLTGNGVGVGIGIGFGVGVGDGKLFVITTVFGNGVGERTGDDVIGLFPTTRWRVGVGV